MFRKTLVFFVLVLAFFVTSCGPMDIAISALDSAPRFVARFNLTPAQAASWNRGFGRGAKSFRAYKAAPHDTKEEKDARRKQLVADWISIVTTDFIPVNDSKASLWLNDIVAFVGGIMGLPPPGSFGNMESVLANVPEFEITEAQAKELKRRIESAGQ